MAEKQKAKKPKQDDPEQSQRFVEAAESLESDKSGKSFERAIKTLVAPESKKPKK